MLIYICIRDWTPINLSGNFHRQDSTLEVYGTNTGGYVNETKQAEFCAFGNLLRNSMLTIEPNFVN